MDKKLKGSWLIHHTQKLQNINSQVGYEDTFLAGKAGILLSALSADHQITLPTSKVNTLAKAANVNTTFELPKLLATLAERHLIDLSANGVALIGITTPSILQHTADIFDHLLPSSQEEAAVALAEKASLAPVLDSEAAGELSDTFHLSQDEVRQVLSEAEQIGFVDAERLGRTERLLFNGNLFRRETPRKIKAVLDTLNAHEQAKFAELTQFLRTHACMPVDAVKTLLGVTLFDKLASIGVFDISVVSNATEEVGFVTLPSAFSKYSSSMVEDAFDLAKAFISSITYGMTKSHHERGRIQMVDALLGALVRGEEVGPVRAIAEDYKILELKGVVAVKQGTKKGRTGPMMRLLKREVGELALQAIRNGDVSEHSLTALPTAAVSRFQGPEHNRVIQRRSQVKLSPKTTNDMLSVLRTGGGF